MRHKATKTAIFNVFSMDYVLKHIIMPVTLMFTVKIISIPFPVKAMTLMFLFRETA